MRCVMDSCKFAVPPPLLLLGYAFMAASSFAEKTSAKMSMKSCSSASVRGGARWRRDGSSVQVMSMPI